MPHFLIQIRDNFSGFTSQAATRNSLPAVSNSFAHSVAACDWRKKLKAWNSCSLDMFGLYIETNRGFLKWGYPKILHFNRMLHYKQTFFGVPTFMETPYRTCYTTVTCCKQSSKKSSCPPILLILAGESIHKMWQNVRSSPGNLGSEHRK